MSSAPAPAESFVKTIMLITCESQSKAGRKHKADIGRRERRDLDRATTDIGFGGDVIGNGLVLHM